MATLKGERMISPVVRTQESEEELDLLLEILKLKGMVKEWPALSFHASVYVYTGGPEGDYARIALYKNSEGVTEFQASRPIEGVSMNERDASEGGLSYMVNI